MLKHFPHSSINFLLHIFNLSWSLHFFSSIWETSFIIPIHTIGKLLDSLSSFGLISFSPPAFQSFLKASFDRVYFSFWSLTSFFLPARPVSAMDDLLLIKFFIFFNPFWMGLTNPCLAIGRFLLLLTSRKLSNLSGTPPFFTNLCRHASLLALLVPF